MSNVYLNDGSANLRSQRFQVRLEGWGWGWGWAWFIRIRRVRKRESVHTSRQGVGIGEGGRLSASLYERARARRCKRIRQPDVGPNRADDPRQCPSPRLRPPPPHPPPPPNTPQRAMRCSHPCPLGGGEMDSGPRRGSAPRPLLSLRPLSRAPTALGAHFLARISGRKIYGGACLEEEGGRGHLCKSS